MGVLYAKVGGTFVPIAQSGPPGPPGGPVPVGGAVGDLIIKNATADFGVRWGIDPPRLNLTDGTLPPLAGGAGPLQVGATTGVNLFATGSVVQARNNGAVSGLHLNYYGGTVTVGAASASLNGAFTVAEPASGTSKRTSMNIGAWQFGQDLAGNGTKDFYIWNPSGNVFKITANGGVFSFGIGALVDLNLDGSQAVNSATTPRLSSNNSYINLHAKTDLYLDGDNVYFRSAAYVDNGRMATDGFHLKDGSWFRAYGQTGIYFASYGGGFNMLDTQWIRAYNGKSIYSPAEIRAATKFSFTATGAFVFTHETDTDTGIVYHSDGFFSLYSQNNPVLRISGGIATIAGNYGARLHLYTETDANHQLAFSNQTPAGSGEASNGPKLQGYSTVWLNTVAGGQFFLASGGSVFINAGKSYLNFSSREFKRNIMALDPDECLDQVRRWRPVEFDVIADGTHADGFIAEDHVAVTPSMVNVCGPDSKRPGWANAIDYAIATPRLAGAIQALVARIEQLERNAA